MANSEVRQVVVTGPTGVLGPATISHLLDAGFSVTAVTRDPEGASKKLRAAVRIVKGDYTSAETLKPSLQNGDQPFDAMVCLLDRDQVDAQLVVTSATIAAGIPHIIPSCFGFGERHLERFKHYPIVANKHMVLSDVMAKSEQGLITHTTIHNGALLDWALDHDILLNFQPGGVTAIIDDGDKLFSATIVDNVAKAIATALSRKQQTANKTLQINNTVITQRQLVTWAKEAAPDREFPTTQLDTAKILEEAQKSYDAGDRSIGTLRSFLLRANAQEPRMEPIHNELLGVRMMTDEEVKQEVIKRLKQQ